MSVFGAIFAHFVRAPAFSWEEAFPTTLTGKRSFLSTEHVGESWSDWCDFIVWLERFYGCAFHIRILSSVHVSDDELYTARVDLEQTPDERNMERGYEFSIVIPCLVFGEEEDNIEHVGCAGVLLLISQ